MKDLRTEYRAAITVWEDRISPVFESSGFLLIVKVLRGLVTDRSIIPFDPEKLQELVSLFRRDGISVLICGAITNEQAEIMQKAGIEIVSFISGNQKDVLKLLQDSQPAWDLIKMPGCRKNSRCRVRCSAVWEKL